MIFSKQELICFNSVLESSKIFGTRISAPIDAGADYVNETLKSLKEKEYLDENGKPTVLFFSAVRMLDQYRKAKKHLFINKSRMAFIDNDNIVFLTEVEDGYQFMKMQKLLFLQSMVLGSEFLKRKDNGIENSVAVEPKEFPKTFKSDDIVGMNYCIEEFEDKKITKAIIMYSIGEKGYIYDLSANQLSTCGSMKLRTTLAGFFGVTAPIKAEKRQEES